MSNKTDTNGSVVLGVPCPCDACATLKSEIGRLKAKLERTIDQHAIDDIRTIVDSWVDARTPSQADLSYRTLEIIRVALLNHDVAAGARDA